LWSYLANNGKLNEITPQNAPLPESFLGKLVRIVTVHDREYFGKLQRIAGGSDVFQLTIEGACCGPIRIDQKEINIIQQIK
jgi:hypothetical protein